MSAAKVAEVVDRCAGARFHSPTPLVLHDVVLADKSVVKLCGTCRDNLGVYVDVQERAGWALEWEVRRTFGNLIRMVGDRGHMVIDDG